MPRSSAHLLRPCRGRGVSAAPPQSRTPRQHPRAGDPRLPRSGWPSARGKRMSSPRLQNAKRRHACLSSLPVPLNLLHARILCARGRFSPRRESEALRPGFEEGHCTCAGLFWAEPCCAGRCCSRRGGCACPAALLPWGRLLSLRCRLFLPPDACAGSSSLDSSAGTWGA